MASTKELPIIWAIRAGIKGEADDMFLHHKLICLSDSSLGDLRNLPPQRQAFYEAYHSVFPSATKTGASGIAGKFFRFIHEMRVGDLILYPSLKDKQVHFAAVTGKYAFEPKRSRKFPHQRKVRWEGAVPKNILSEPAKRELGAARTLFTVKSNAEEIRTLVAGKERQ